MLSDLLLINEMGIIWLCMESCCSVHGPVCRYMALLFPVEDCSSVKDKDCWSICWNNAGLSLQKTAGVSVTVKESMACQRKLLSVSQCEMVCWSPCHCGKLLVWRCWKVLVWHCPTCHGSCCKMRVLLVCHCGKLLFCDCNTELWKNWWLRTARAGVRRSSNRGQRLSVQCPLVWYSAVRRARWRGYHHWHANKQRAGIDPASVIRCNCRAAKWAVGHPGGGEPLRPSGLSQCCFNVHREPRTFISTFTQLLSSRSSDPVAKTLP